MLFFMKRPGLHAVQAAIEDGIRPVRSSQFKGALFSNWTESEQKKKKKNSDGVYTKVSVLPVRLVEEHRTGFPPVRTLTAYNPDCVRGGTPPHPS